MLHVPGESPVTEPEEFTVAMAGLLLLQAPVPPFKTTPLAVYTVVAPIHKGLIPVTEMTEEFGPIVIVCCADVIPPQPPVIV